MREKTNSHIFKNRFQKNSGVYICVICEKKTRETGTGESQYSMCRDCMNEQENQNAESDGNIIDLTPCGSKKIEEIHCKMYKSGDFTQ